MKLSQLSQTTGKPKKRIGRGHGSGRGGHTSTRGTKGQNSRSKVGLFFEGTKIKKSLLKRLPLFRGKGKFKPFKPEPFVVNLKYLTVFKENEEVTLESLKTKGILTKDLPADASVKILGEGEVSVPLRVFLPISKNAQEKIEKVGGQVEVRKESGETGKLKAPKETETKREEKNQTAKMKKKVTRKSVKKVEGN